MIDLFRVSIVFWFVIASLLVSVFDYCGADNQCQFLYHYSINFQSVNMHGKGRENATQVDLSVFVNT